MNGKFLISVVVILVLVYLLSKPMARASGNAPGTNDEHLKSLPPSARLVFRRFIQSIEHLGYTVKIRDSLRTSEQQASYKQANKKNAAPGTSAHEFGLAIDMDVYANGKLLSKRTPRADWINSGVPRIASEYGIKWGGNFTNYADNNHFYIKKT